MRPDGHFVSRCPAIFSKKYPSVGTRFTKCVPVSRKIGTGREIQVLVSRRPGPEIIPASGPLDQPISNFFCESGLKGYIVALIKYRYFL